MSIDRPDRNDRAMHSRGSCDTCKWCGIVSAADKVVQFVCRFNPPVVNAALVMGPQGPAWSGTSSWPNVAKTDWCSKYEPQLH